MSRAFAIGGLLTPLLITLVLLVAVTALVAWIIVRS